jgi:hypothetical protein
VKWFRHYGTAEGSSTEVIRFTPERVSRATGERQKARHRDGDGPLAISVGPRTAYSINN